MTFSKKLVINGLHYTIRAPSEHKYKKYDVYLESAYMLSFGDNRYEQYHDKLGFYQKKDHLDPKRRLLYNIRHSKGGKSPYYAGWWSKKFLW